jgi:hypothetical protein
MKALGTDRSEEMNKLATTLVITFFATGVNAADVYHGLDEGNADLSTPRLSAEDFAGVQPSVGDSVERYHGLAEGNPDLFKTDRNVLTKSSRSPNIYGAASGNPDLQF